MNVLIFGGTGLVGTALARVLREQGHRLRAPGRESFDISAGGSPDDLLQGVECVVNAAVVKNISESPEEAARVNIDFPQKLSRLCSAAGLPIIQISSDGVFSGCAGPYQESAAPDADDPYGRQKAAGEPPDCLVLRTSVIGPEANHFTSLMCWFLRQREACVGFTNHLWNGVTSIELARAIGRIIAPKPPAPGIRHIYSDDVSKYELLLALREAFGRAIEIEPVAASTACDRRLRTEFPDFHAACELAPLAAQIAELPRYCDDEGRWRN